MGHITLLGPSMGIVEARLKSMLREEIEDEQPTGQSLYFTVYSESICGPI